jgi:hypothetical protein
MKIVSSEIVDVLEEDPDRTKVYFAENIVRIMSPILDEYYNEKIERVTSVRQEMKDLKTRAQSKKEEMTGMLSHHKKLTKTAKLLSRIDKIISSGLTYGSTKRELVIILKILDKLSEEKLEVQMNNMMAILSKGLNR